MAQGECAQAWFRAYSFTRIVALGVPTGRGRIIGRRREVCGWRRKRRIGYQASSSLDRRRLAYPSGGAARKMLTPCAGRPLLAPAAVACRRAAGVLGLRTLG